MKSLLAGGTCAAAIVAFGIVAYAQTTQTPPPQPETQATAQAPEQPVTIVGCVQKEADYRRLHDLGKGGAVGTGVGVGNEFVLVNATISTMAGAPTPPAPTGTAGTAKAYEMTGEGESQLEQHVGKRVEITGKLKHAERAAGKPTGGDIDPLNKDLKLPEIEVSSVREASGECPPIQK